MLIVLATDGGDREDGSVYYSEYILVDVPKDQESAVNDALGEDTDDLSLEEVLDLLRATGYPVQRIDPVIATYNGED